MVIDRRDRTINLCEIKYTSDEYAITGEYEEKLRKKIRVFREATGTRKALQLMMITTYGVKRNAHSSLVQVQLKMDDLFV